MPRRPLILAVLVFLTGLLVTTDRRVPDDRSLARLVSTAQRSFRDGGCGDPTIAAPGQPAADAREPQPAVQRIPPGVTAIFRLPRLGPARASSLCLYIDRRGRARALAAAVYGGRAGRLLTTGFAPGVRAGAWNRIRLHAFRLLPGRTYWIALHSTRGILEIRHAQGCRAATLSRGSHFPLRLPARVQLRACAAPAYLAGGPPRIEPTTGLAAPSPPSLKLPACSERLGPSVDLAQRLRSAPGGTVICLESGAYTSGTVVGGMTPSSLVTLEPAPGASVTFTQGLTLVGPVQHLAVLGFQSPSNLLGGMTISSQGGAITDVSVSYDNFDGSARPGDAQLVLADTRPDSHIAITHDTFIDVSPCPSGCAEGTISLYNTAADNDPDGITIAHNLISGGLADGINIGGNESGTQILDNEITGKLQASAAQCSAYAASGGCPHTDGIQFEGDARDVVIFGNYMQDNTDDLLQADGSNTDATVTNNVFAVADVRLRAVQVAGWHGGSFSHNTVGSYSTWDCTHEQTCTSGVTLTDNIFQHGFGYGVQTTGGQFSIESYNLTAYCPTACGAHDLRGKATFRGGASPSSYLGWRLAAGSLGTADASDGQDRGADSFSITPGP